MTTNKVLHIQPITLNKRIKSGDDICLVDVREDWEYSLTSIKGSTHIPLNELADRVQEIMFEEEIDDDECRFIMHFFTNEIVIFV